MEQYNKSFAGYIKELCDKQEISFAQLSKGVCSANLLKRFVKTEKGVSKNIQDCLLGRLGIGAEGFFYLLGAEEYAEWYARAEIIYEIIWKRLDSVKEKLITYKEKWCDNVLNRQFYYAMMATVAACREKEKQKIYSLWEAAKNETIPDVTAQNIKKYCLSVQELDILLSYYHYRDETSHKDFRDILDYIGDRPYDEQAKGKTLPKAFLYYVEKLKQESEPTAGQAEALLAEATKIMEAMRERDQMLYLWEMLKLRAELYAYIRTELQEEESAEEKENTGWLWAFEKVYGYFEYPRETKETAIIYYTKNVDCVNETIRKRRQLLGYSRKQLAEMSGCSERTIERIERKEVSPQKPVAGVLFETMGMPADYSKSELIVENVEDRELLVKLERALNRQENEKARVFHYILDERLEDSSRYNKQVLMQWKSVLDRREGRISTEEYLAKQKEIWEMSLPWSTVLEIKDSESAFSALELTILNAFVKYGKVDSLEQQRGLQILEDYCSPFLNTTLEINLKMFLDMIMATVADGYGDNCYWEKSNEYCMHLGRIALESKRGGRLDWILYALWWNENERKKATGQCLDDRYDLLQCCVELAQYKRLEYLVRFYNEQIEIVNHLLEACPKL